MASVYSRRLGVLGVALPLLVLFLSAVTPVHGEEYVLTITATVGGTTNPTPGSYLYVPLTEVSVTAVPDSGYYFDHWELDGYDGGAPNPITFCMDRDHTLHAAFGLICIPTEEYNFITKWGSYGSGDGQFDCPFGVAVDGSGNVYVTDSHNRRVQKFTSSGVFITKWGSWGSGDGQFSIPWGVAVDSSGNVYVVDSEPLDRVQKFTSSGVFITKWGSFGSGDGQFSIPCGVAVDSSGNVYVVEHGGGRVQKFTSSGEFITKWGGDGQFAGPCGVAVDSSGNVYVADTLNHRVQKFTSSGEFITKWGSYGHGEGLFNEPIGIAVDSSGNVYVAEGNHRVQKFTDSGVFITKWGSFGSGDGQFNWPYGVAVDGSGNVYVTDSVNDRVQKFGIEYRLTITATVGGTTNPAPGSYLYVPGTVVTVLAMPDYGYNLYQWELDGAYAGETDPISITMNQDHTLRAVFYPTLHWLTITSTYGGTTNPSPGKYEFSPGTATSVTATPYLGYHFDHWELDGSHAGATNPFSVTMDQNHSLHAVFYSGDLPEFPIGFILEVAIIPTLFYVWWKRKQKISQ